MEISRYTAFFVTFHYQERAKYVHPLAIIVESKPYNNAENKHNFNQIVKINGNHEHHTYLHHKFHVSKGNRLITYCRTYNANTHDIHHFRYKKFLMTIKY